MKYFLLNQYQLLPLYPSLIRILGFTSKSVNSGHTFLDLSTTASIPAPCRHSLSVLEFVCLSLSVFHSYSHIMHILPLFPLHDLKVLRKLKDHSLSHKCWGLIRKTVLLFFKLGIKISTMRKIKMTGHPTIQR